MGSGRATREATGSQHGVPVASTSDQPPEAGLRLESPMLRYSCSLLQGHAPSVELARPTATA
jgi:hypothetical protein